MIYIPPPLPVGVLMSPPTVAIDFDGTLYAFGPLLDEPPPLPDAVAAVRALAAAGYRIVILTSRLSTHWVKAVARYRWHAFEQGQHDHIAAMLVRDGIPFDAITAEKIPADFYIDDRAIPFTNNWSEIAAAILAVGVREVAA